MDKESIVCTDGFSSHDGLVDRGYRRRYRVNHGADEFVERANRRNHVNGIESSWGSSLFQVGKEKFNLAPRGGNSR